jgi:hypothetical protein
MMLDIIGAGDFVEILEKDGGVRESAWEAAWSEGRRLSPEAAVEKAGAIEVEHRPGLAWRTRKRQVSLTVPLRNFVHDFWRSLPLFENLDHLVEVAIESGRPQAE